MVAWFIIAIATLAVFALIAVNGVQTVAATTDGVGRVETTRRVEAAVAAITARTGSPNNTGKAMVVAGLTVDGVYGLPAEMSAFASTPFGQRIVYCPFGDGESGTAGTVPAGGGATYPVEVKPDASGRVYVTAGRPNFPQVAENPNLMAYVIAPRTKASPTPTCNSVRFNPNTSRFEAPDAIVRPVIRAAASEDQRQQAGREVVYYVSGNGTGRGLSPNDPTSLYSAISYYRTALPQAMRIIMTTGTYQLPAQYLNATVGGFADKGNAGTLVIEGANSQLDFTGASDIWVPGNLDIRDLTISSAVGVWAEQGHKVTLTNTSSGYIVVNNGGILQATNITAIDSRNSNYALRVTDGSSAAISGTVNLVASNGQVNGYVTAGSRLVFENATINMSAPGGSIGFGLYNEENTDLVFKSSNLVLNTPAAFPVLVKGRTTFYNSNVTMNVANSRLFEVQMGGFLSLNGGTFGVNAAPQYAIIDVGASGFSGTATLRSTIACWTNAGVASGTQFNQSASGNGSTSVVTGNEGAPGMSANPTAAEVQANAAVNARNMQRSTLRNTNTSNYACQI